MAAAHDPLIRLQHIRNEIAALREALIGSDFDAFCQSYVLRRTTEHAILIISEAVRSLPSDLTGRFAHIDWRAIRDIGNILRHEYYSVDVRILWRIARDRLPELDAVVNEMLDG